MKNEPELSDKPFSRKQIRGKKTNPFYAPLSARGQKARYRVVAKYGALTNKRRSWSHTVPA